MHFLLTGGAGFVGSHLADRLLALGARITVLDDLSTGSRANLDLTRVLLREGSVLDVVAVRALVATADRVIHLASEVGVDRVAGDPERARTVIEDGTRVVLDACAARGVPLVALSSSEVYGFAPPTPVREDDLPDSIDGAAPRLAYARAKLAADRACRAARSRGAPVLVVRPFNVVGARQSKDGGAVLPRFVESALAGLDLEVHGDGAQRRTFVDARDVAAWLARLAEFERWPFDAVNLGGVEEWSIKDLAELVRARLASRSRVVAVPPPLPRGNVEVLRRVPDLARLESLLGPFAPVAPRHRVVDAIDALAAEARSVRSPALAVA